MNIRFIYRMKRSSVNLLAEHGFQQAVINRAEVVGDIQINDGLDLLAIEVLMQCPERLVASPARSEAIGTVQEQGLIDAFQDVGASSTGQPYPPGC